MASEKLTALTAATAITPASLVYTVPDPGTPVSHKATLRQGPLLTVQYSQTNFGDVVLDTESGSVVGTGTGSMVIPANTIQLGCVIEMRFITKVTVGGTSDVEGQFFANGSNFISTQVMTLSGEDTLFYGICSLANHTLGGAGTWYGYVEAVRTNVANLSADVATGPTVFATNAAITLDYKINVNDIVTVTPILFQVRMFQPGA